MVTPEEYKLVTKLVKSLRAKFYNKTGKVIRIEVTEIDNTNLVDLNLYSIYRIRKIVNEYIPEEITTNRFITCISQKSRVKPLPDLRKIYCKVAREMGFTYTTIAKTGFAGADHTDARAAKRVAENYLAAGIEKRFISLYYTIKKRVDNDYRDIFNLPETEDQSESVIFNDLLQG